MSHLHICNLILIHQQLNKSYNVGIINKSSEEMVPICGSLTHGTAACSCNALQFDVNSDVTHVVYIFHHILCCFRAPKRKGSVVVGVGCG